MTDPTFDKDIELAKVNIVADVIHNEFNLWYSAVIGITLAGQAIVYSAYLAHQFDILYTTEAAVATIIGWYLWTRHRTKRYEKQLAGIDWLIENFVKNEKRLPSIPETVEFVEHFGRSKNP